MSNYPSAKIQGVIAAEGDFQLPLLTAEEAGAGHMSYEAGFGPETQTPVEVGGVPPFRADFNGLANLFSQFLLWYQQGGILRYDSSIDYEPTNEVFFNGTKYRCLVANGPSSAVCLPGTNKSIWKSRDTPSVLAGQVAAFTNCRLGGSDGRRLIPWGETEADERYVICDGGSDGRGGTVPNLIGKFIYGSAVAECGQTGGAVTQATDTKTVTGTVQPWALTTDQLPAHSHPASTSPSGAHAHTRGTFNITGRVGNFNLYATQAIGSGAFYSTVNGGFVGVGKGDWDNAQYIDFDASRTWTGETSTSGSHSHTVSVESTGSGAEHSHGFTAQAHAHNVSVLPPFLKLAYFVKLPE